MFVFLFVRNSKREHRKLCNIFLGAFVCLFCFWVQEMVRSCLQLMHEYLTDTCPAAGLKDERVEPAPPPSPIGVLDAAACGSCDTRSENPGFTGLAEAVAEAEPPHKRLRSSAPDVQQR